MAQATVTLKLTPGEFRHISGALGVAYRVYQMVHGGAETASIEGLVGHSMPRATGGGKASVMRRINIDANFGADIP